MNQNPIIAQKDSAASSTYRVVVEVLDFELDPKTAKEVPKSVDLTLSVYEVPGEGVSSSQIPR